MADWPLPKAQRPALQPPGAKRQRVLCGVFATTPDLGISRGFGEDTTIPKGGTPQFASPYKGSCRYRRR